MLPRMESEEVRKPPWTPRPSTTAGRAATSLGAWAIYPDSWSTPRSPFGGASPPLEFGGDCSPSLKLGHHKSFLHRFNGFLAARNITSHELKTKHPREESLQSRKQKIRRALHLHKRNHVTVFANSSPSSSTYLSNVTASYQSVVAFVGTWSRNAKIV